MADVKISGLPASTVPLAGTEVLPIVQGGATKQVSIANVTAGRAIAATSITTDTYKAASSSGGVLQNSSGTAQLQWGSGGGNNLSVDVAININPANAAVAISPTGTGTVAISPAGALTINPATASTINNTSIGASTASTGRFTSVTATTGNVVIGTSGQGIDFSATPNTGTSELLADYEEGTWTPTVAGFGSPTYTVQNGNYTKVGNLVHITGKLSFTGASGSSAVSIGGLPYASGNPTDAFQRSSCFVVGDFTGCSTFIASYGMFRTNGTSLQGVKAVAGASALADASDFLATVSFNFSLTYYV